VQFNYLEKNSSEKLLSGLLSVHRGTRVIPKVSGLDILDNNIFQNLYISETYILHEL